MTIAQQINQLIILRERTQDRREREALSEAIQSMKSASEWYIRAYMRGYHDAKVKGVEA